MECLIRVRASRSVPRELCCPFCKDSLEGQGAFVECAACATWFHEECFLENQGCMTMGCSEQRSKLPVPRPAPVRARPLRRPASRARDVSAPLGNTPLDSAIAAIHAAVFATGAMIVTAATTHHDRQIVPVAVAVFCSWLGLELKWGQYRPGRTRLSGDLQFGCVLCGFFSGLVGGPLFLYGLLSDLMV